MSYFAPSSGESGLDAELAVFLKSIPFPLPFIIRLARVA